MAAIETKKDVEKKLDNEPVKKPFWETTPPIVLIIGGFLLWLAFRSIQLSGNNNYLILVIIVVVIIFLMSKNKETEQKIVNPREAELLTERECERKVRWGQWSPMTEFKVGPVSDLKHTDGRGQYYNVQVTVFTPFERIRYYTAKVMAAGNERGFVTLIQTISPLHGRQIQQEHDLIKGKNTLNTLAKYPVLERLWGLR